MTAARAARPAAKPAAPGALVVTETVVAVATAAPGAARPAIGARTQGAASAPAMAAVRGPEAAAAMAVGRDPAVAPGAARASAAPVGQPATAGPAAVAAPRDPLERNGAAAPRRATPARTARAAAGRWTPVRIRSRARGARPTAMTGPTAAAPQTIGADGLVTTPDARPGRVGPEGATTPAVVAATGRDVPRTSMRERITSSGPRAGAERLPLGRPSPKTLT